MVFIYLMEHPVNRQTNRFNKCTSQFIHVLDWKQKAFSDRLREDQAWHGTVLGILKGENVEVRCLSKAVEVLVVLDRELQEGG